MPFDGQTVNSIALGALAFFDFDSTYKVSVMEHPDYLVIGIVDHNKPLTNGKFAYCHMRFDKARVLEMDEYEFFMWICTVYNDWLDSLTMKNYEKKFANGRKTPGQPAFRDWL